MYIKRKKFLLFIISSLLIFTITGCVDFEQIANDELGIQDELKDEEVAKSVSLGDVNDDGKEEKLIVESTTLKLISGLRVMQKFELDEDYEYYSLKAYVVDIDNDDNNEIIALIKSSERNVQVVKIINQAAGGEYELYDFPEEISSNETVSGVNAEITAKDGFKYVITKGDFSVEIDASRIYGLSLRNQEDYEKIERVWSEIMNSDFQGEVLGVTNIYIMHKSSEEVVLDVYECVTGGDDYIIGYLVTEMVYDSDGNYTIKNVRFRERIDVMP